MPATTRGASPGTRGRTVLQQNAETPGNLRRGSCRYVTHVLLTRSETFGRVGCHVNDVGERRFELHRKTVNDFRRLDRQAVSDGIGEDSPDDGGPQGHANLAGGGEDPEAMPAIWLNIPKRERCKRREGRSHAEANYCERKRQTPRADPEA